MEFLNMTSISFKIILQINTKYNALAFCKDKKRSSGVIHNKWLNASCSVLLSPCFYHACPTTCRSLPTTRNTKYV